MCSGRGYQILASFAFKVKHTWLISQKGNSNGVKKELFWVKNG